MLINKISQSKKVPLIIFIAVGLVLVFSVGVYAIYNRPNMHGYFTGQDKSGGSWETVFTPGTSAHPSTQAMPGVFNKAQFFSIIEQKLNRTHAVTNAQGGKHPQLNEAAAAFMVDTMLGKWGTDFGTINSGVTYAKNHINDWKDRVTYYDDAGCVNYNENVWYGFEVNSMNTNKGADWEPVYYNKNLGYWQRSVVFREPLPGGGCGAVNAEIKKNCGNPIGDVTLKEPPPIIIGPPPKPNSSCNGAAVVFNGAGQCDGSYGYSVDASKWSSKGGGHTIPLDSIDLTSAGASAGSSTDSASYGSSAGTFNFEYDDENGDVNIEWTATYSVTWSEPNPDVEVCDLLDPSNCWMVPVADTIYSDSVVENGTDTAPQAPCNWSMANQSTDSTGWAGGGVKYPKPGDGVTPGDKIEINMEAINNGIQGSGNEMLCAYVKAGADYLDFNAPASYQLTQKVIKGGTMSQNVSWTLKDSTEDNMPNGAVIHIVVQLTPLAGDRTGYTDVGSDSIDYYYYIFNERFDFFDGMTGGNKINDLALDAYFPGAGEKDPPGPIPVNAEFNNSDPAISKYKGADGGIAPAGAMTATLSVTGPATIVDGSTNNSDIPWNDSFLTGGGLSLKINKDAIVGQQVCATVTLTPNNGYSHKGDERGIPGDPMSFAKDCFFIKDGPYMHVLNGDVWSGANFDTGTNSVVESTCGALNGDSRIRTIERSNNLSALYRGSFVEYAAFATGDIVNFATAIAETDAKSQPASLDPDSYSLTFRNKPSLGHFTSDPRCIPNFFGLLYGAGKKITAAQFNLALNTSSDQYWKDGNLRIGGTGQDQKIASDITIVVKGNVYIIANGANDTIEYIDKYDRDLKGNPKIPSLIIVASGDIFIDEDITELDAVLIAHGEVHTCSTKTTGNNLKEITELNTQTCDEPLTINGAIIANRINFMRTNGTTGGVHNPNSEPSEIISYSPEFYLSDPIFKSNVANLGELRAMLFKDLPPVY